MFPEIFRDDVFRLETQRLWLRWPTARDESAIERLAGLRDVAEMTASIPHPYPKGAAASFIYGARVGNAQGAALTFALAPLARPHELIGIISLRGEDGTTTLGYWLGPQFRGRGLMSEAVEALAGSVFQIAALPSIGAYTRADNLASRRVLEKSGFAQTGEATRHFPMRDSAFACVFYARARADGIVRAGETVRAALR